MNLELNQDGLYLKPKQLLKVRAARGHTIVCHSGEVWVTQEGDRRDIILGAGESFALDRKGQALVQAFGQSAISIASPAHMAGSEATAAIPGSALAGAAFQRHAVGA